MQEAIIVEAPPVDDPVAVPVVDTLTAPGLEELQVKGNPVIVLPRESTMVGVIVVEVLVAAVTVSVIDCTGQVVKLIGTLLTLPMVAKIEVRPGAFAVTSSCPGARIGSDALSVATFVF